MRASRLVSLLLLLQARGRMTARELACELEVSVRTIYRDADSLHAAGVPLYGDAGPCGGYQLLDGYRTRLTGLTEEEAESLFLAGLPGPAADLGLGQAVSAAQLKLMAALPSGLKERAERIASRFHLDAPGWHDGTEETPFLADVAGAVWDGQVIEIGYRRWKSPEDVTRTLEPYGLVLKGGRWYLVARHRRLATYRVSQIQSLRVPGERFTRSAGFDLAAYWRRSLVEFQARQHTGEAVIRLSPRGWERFPTVVVPVVAQVAEESATPDGNGWVRTTIPIETLDYTVGHLLRLGPDVEVVAPAELRDLMTDAAAGLAALYLR